MPSDRNTLSKKDIRIKIEEKTLLKNEETKWKMSLSSSLKPIYPVACAVGHRLFGSLNAVLKRGKNIFNGSLCTYYLMIIFIN